MKKIIAVLLVVVLLACGCTAAFAKSHAVMTWNEELQHWEIEIIDDGPDDEPFTPNYEDYQNMFPDGYDPFGGIEFHPMSEDTGNIL